MEKEWDSSVLGPRKDDGLSNGHGGLKKHAQGARLTAYRLGPAATQLLCPWPSCVLLTSPPPKAWPKLQCPKGSAVLRADAGRRRPSRLGCNVRLRRWRLARLLGRKLFDARELDHSVRRIISISERSLYAFKYSARGPRYAARNCTRGYIPTGSAHGIKGSTWPERSAAMMPQSGLPVLVSPTRCARPSHSACFAVLGPLRAAA